MATGIDAVPCRAEMTRLACRAPKLSSVKYDSLSMILLVCSLFFVRFLVKEVGIHGIWVV